MDSQAQADLIGADVSVSNSVMDHMVLSFAEPSVQVNLGAIQVALEADPLLAALTSPGAPVEEPKPAVKPRIRQSKSKVW